MTKNSKPTQKPFYKINSPHNYLAARPSKVESEADKHFRAERIKSLCKQMREAAENENRSK
jgi:hypothetical protein